MLVTRWSLTMSGPSGADTLYLANVYELRQALESLMRSCLHDSASGVMYFVERHHLQDGFEVEPSAAPASAPGAFQSSCACALRGAL